MGEAILMNFRWKLRQVMADRKMPVGTLADKMGLNRATISDWAKSDKLPNFRSAHETIRELAIHLDCKLFDLLEEIEAE